MPPWAVLCSETLMNFTVSHLCYLHLSTKFCSSRAAVTCAQITMGHTHIYTHTQARLQMHECI